jgi:hypothetical protein
MRIRDRIGKYLRRQGASPARPLLAASTDGVEQAIVIPALAESASLFATLCSIAVNPPADLEQCLVICVVNNHRPGLAPEEEILDNRRTMDLLEGLVSGKAPGACLPRRVREDLRSIAGSGLRLACIDASSAGWEISDRDGGVGTARKIGMDAAMGILDGRAAGGGVVCCLDADTRVESNYLGVFRRHFERTGNPAAVAAYAHRKPAAPRLLSAISDYEIFLRAYVIGLAHAGSPYAFHAIGSTMACTADGYLGVRGMNRRAAAEDFHFLDKLRKLGRIDTVTETTVFPSPRPSRRVPFGTGRRIQRFLNADDEEVRLHDPEVFVLLGEWLSHMEAEPDRDPETIRADAGRIHVRLEEYLRMSGFDANWRAIRANSRDSGHLRRQFHIWFDGLKTLKMIHHLSRSAFPMLPLFDGLRGLLDRVGGAIPSLPAALEKSPAPELRWRILQELRSRFPAS